MTAISSDTHARSRRGCTLYYTTSRCCCRDNTPTTSAAPSVQARATAEEAARLLASDERVQLVYLFGSAADTDRAYVRDIDIAVLTQPALSLDELMRVRADLVTAIGAPIDLVSLNDAPVVLGWEIADSGRCLFARVPETGRPAGAPPKARGSDLATRRHRPARC